MSKSINHNAPIKGGATITINAPPEKVWAVVKNIDNWASWQTDITKPKLHGELKPGTRFDWKMSGVQIHSTLHTVEPFKQFGWTGESLGMSAINCWTFTEVNGQTQVSVGESMEGFVAGLLSKLIQPKLAESMGTWLELLKKECEK